MKYCVKCGNELFDEAVFCTKCGVMLGTHIQPIRDVKESVEVKNTDKSKSSILYLVFGFISNILSIASAFFLLLSIRFSYVDCYARSVAESHASSTFYKYSNSIRTYVDTVVDTDVSGYLYFEEGAVILAFIFSIITLICSVCCLIFALIKRSAIKDIFSAITKIFLALGLGIISLAYIG